MCGYHPTPDQLSNSTNKRENCGGGRDLTEYFSCSRYRGWPRIPR